MDEVQPVHAPMDMQFRVLLPNPVLAWMDYIQRNAPRLMFEHVDPCLFPVVSFDFIAMPQTSTHSVPIHAEVTESTPGKKRARAPRALSLVDTAERRSTRSSIKNRWFQIDAHDRQA